jgi:predicted small integral membrane protein
MDLSWMHWTTPSAVFFVCLALALTVMTVWDIVSPSVQTEGFLSVPLSRGERFFIAIVIAIGIMLLWIALLPKLSLWYAVAVALIVDFIVARYG